MSSSTATTIFPGSRFFSTASGFLKFHLEKNTASAIIAMRNMPVPTAIPACAPLVRGCDSDVPEAVDRGTDVVVGMDWDIVVMRTDIEDGFLGTLVDIIVEAETLVEDEGEVAIVDELPAAKSAT
jgi:hypothetical protein